MKAKKDVYKRQPQLSVGPVDDPGGESMVAQRQALLRREAPATVVARGVQRGQAQHILGHRAVGPLHGIDDLHRARSDVYKRQPLAWGVDTDRIIAAVAMTASSMTTGCACAAAMRVCVGPSTCAVRTLSLIHI